MSSAALAFLCSTSTFASQTIPNGDFWACFASKRFFRIDIVLELYSISCKRDSAFYCILHLGAYTETNILVLSGLRANGW